MVSKMLTTEDQTARYRYAVKLMNYYPEKSANIYSYVKDLDDDKLLARVDSIAGKLK